MDSNSFYSAFIDIRFGTGVAFYIYLGAKVQFFRSGLKITKQELMEEYYEKISKAIIIHINV